MNRPLINTPQVCKLPIIRWGVQEAARSLEQLPFWV